MKYFSIAFLILAGCGMDVKVKQTTPIIVEHRITWDSLMPVYDLQCRIAQPHADESEIALCIVEKMKKYKEEYGV